MSSTLSRESHPTHPSRRAPLVASAAVLGVLAVGAIAGITVNHGEGTPRSRPDPPVASYPGSSAFDNQPTGLSRPGA
jgi:hypothetical protein